MYEKQVRGYIYITCEGGFAPLAATGGLMCIELFLGIRVCG